MAGVYQINVTPQVLATDRLYLRAGGKLSNVVQLPLQPGQNVTNASGSIQVVYPTAQEPVASSPHLLLVRFSARMDIGAAARPFAIAVVTEGTGSAVIAVDPVNGSFEATLPAPTAAARNGDFSSSPDLRLDLFTCQMTPDGPTAFPFPGNILPFSRISPQEFQALSLVPMPTTQVAGSATGLLRVQGQVQRGATFVIDESTNTPASTFASYIAVGSLCARDQTTTVRLLIDGRQVASTVVNYTAGGVPFPGGEL